VSYSPTEWSPPAGLSAASDTSKNPFITAADGAEARLSLMVLAVILLMAGEVASGGPLPDQSGRASRTDGDWFWRVDGPVQPWLADIGVSAPCMASGHVIARPHPTDGKT